MGGEGHPLSAVAIDRKRRSQLSLEQRIEREWWWLNGAMHAVAQVQAEGPRVLREIDAQARHVDRLRVAIAVRLAELTGRPDGTHGR